MSISFSQVSFWVAVLIAIVVEWSLDLYFK